MTLAVAAATFKELKAALAFLGPLPEPGPGESLPFAARGLDLALCVTGVGLVNAALAAGRLLACAPLSGLVNIGVAGSSDLSLLPLGAVCAAASETWPEYGLEAPEGPDPRALRFPVHAGPGGVVWQDIPLDPGAAARAMGLALPPDLPLARGLSVSTVTATAATAARLRERHGPGMENMEGFALALACLRAGLPFLELRAVSNRVGARPPEGWDLPGALSALGRACAAIFGFPPGKKQDRVHPS